MNPSESALPPVPVSAQDLETITVGQWQAVLTAKAHDAAAWVQAAAQLGHTDAQAVLGQWLLDGHRLARDPAQALHWFLRAAQSGHAMARNMAGRCHEEGWGTAEDADKAAHWYRLAAQSGLPQAQYNLANLLASGKGLARDHPQAYALYQQAAGQGYAKAHAKLGRYHEDGLAVPKDAAAAFDHYRLGAEGGDFRGQFCYAGMLAAQGQQTEALQWLAKVIKTATPRYLRMAGELLLQSPDPQVRQMGQRMLDRSVDRSLV